MKKVLMMAVTLGMTGGAYAAKFSDLAVNAATLKTSPADVPEANDPAGFSREGSATMDADLTGTPSRPVEWVAISGGEFTMGTDGKERGFKNTWPARLVFLKAFAISKTEVTVEQYAECVIEGQCTEPAGHDSYCNWSKPGRRFHPVNCVSWRQATQYALFKSKQPGYEGARLPSESEWEYAATGGGKNQRYPWGDEEPTCERTVMHSKGHVGCGTDFTMPVGSKPAGNTAQGVSDMAGNVWEWVRDSYLDSYIGVPVDGSSVEIAESKRVVRGGSFINFHHRVMRAAVRYGVPPTLTGGHIGFRLAR